MSSIRLITDESTLYFSDPSNTYLISKEKAFVFFRPRGRFLIVGFLQHIESQETAISEVVKEAISNDIGVVYVCDKLPDNPIISKNIIYIKVQWAWLIHTLFFNPLLFRGVFGNKSTQRVVNAFNCFTKFKIPIISILTDVQDMSHQAESVTNNILCEIEGGIGDHLLCIPTLKTLNSQGKNVSLLVSKHRKSCFNNLPYISDYYFNRNDIDVSNFDSIHWLNFGQVLNDYRRELNQQNRIFAVANLCSIDERDLVIQTPEIILTQEEIDFGLSLKKELKNTLFFGFDSARADSKIPLQLAQDIIYKLKDKGFTIFTTAIDKKILNGCINLTGQLSERQLFSIIYVMDSILTIDTSFLHIAGAFNKRTFALMNYFKPDWRTSTYQNCVNYTPNIKCFPCISGQYVAAKDRSCAFGNSCYNNFDWTQIIKDISKVLK